MPGSRAQKNVMRGSKGPVKGAVVTDSGKGPGMGMAKKQYNFPKKIYTGPNYPQDEPQKGVSMKGVLK